MEGNKRPEMERITTPELAEKFIAEQLEALRAAADEAERLTAAAYWPYPSYSELLYSV